MKDKQQACKKPRWTTATGVSFQRCDKPVGHTGWHEHNADGGNLRAGWPDQGAQWT